MQTHILTHRIRIDKHRERREKAENHSQKKKESTEHCCCFSHVYFYYYTEMGALNVIFSSFRLPHTRKANVRIDEKKSLSFQSLKRNLQGKKTFSHKKETPLFIVEVEQKNEN